MRNIRRMTVKLKPFYPTYEELKSVVNYDKYQNGAQLFILPMRNWNKNKAKTLQDAIYLFILPMRNWNVRHLLELVREGRTFLSYLWGIEILVRWNVKPTARSFLSYLWGIEIFHNVSLSAAAYWLFILPMRNWNCITWRRRLSWSTFYPTYEELKFTFFSLGV